MLSRIDQMAPLVKDSARQARIVAYDFLTKAKSGRVFQAKIDIDSQACDAVADILVSLATSMEILLLEGIELDAKVRYYERKVGNGVGLAEKLNALSFFELWLWWAGNWRGRRKARRDMRLGLNR